MGMGGVSIPTAYAVIVAVVVFVVVGGEIPNLFCLSVKKRKKL